MTTIDCEERAKGQLAEAIKTMRQACDQAERDIKRCVDPHDATDRVLHALSWGFANASSGVTGAISWMKEAKKISEIEQVG